MCGGETAGGHIGPPLRTNRNIVRRAGEDTRPYGGKQNRSVGSEMAGAELEPHRLKFLHTQGPVARWEFRLLLRFCAPEIFCPTQGITHVMGDRG